MPPNAVLPAHRSRTTLTTADGERLAAELAVPADRAPEATLILVHPLPTAGGSMDSHLFTKIANRLPAQAGYAVLRFNTRGTKSASGESSGTFAAGRAERHDLDAAIDFAVARFLPRIWLVGWSFGTDLVLLYGLRPQVEGAILLSPPLLRADDDAMARWALAGKPLKVLVPQFDDYLRPAAAAQRFAAVPHADVVPMPGAGHLFIGEKYVQAVLDQIVAEVTPGKPVHRPPLSG